ncbi:basic secretory protein-like protein [Dactylosporangium sp. McL0621]|uniref:basic secretory protein-like protein n=1 Tax=Dactylosporangium sp. McL0621 TaxID=3415678 RepID=UPI003CF3CFF3
MVGDARRRAGGDVTASYPALPHQRAPQDWDGPTPPIGLRRYTEEPPKPGSSTVFRAALVVTLAVLLLAPAGAIAFATVRMERSTVVSGQGLAGAGGRDTGGRPGAQAERPGTAGATANPPPTGVDGRIRRALADQADALLGGDEDGFLRAVDPSAGGLREDLARRFGSLRQLQVKIWQPAVEARAKTEAGGTASATVLVRYCFVVTTCDPMSLEADTRWKVAGQSVTLLEFSVAKDLGPRPWEVSELRAQVGNRVVMATTAKYASRLPSMLAAAEQAAALTDTFARWGPPPARYVVYLAGPDEWSKWYGMRQEAWVAGFALPLTASATEIVLNAARVDTKQTLDVLRHEFTHVVTLAGVEKAYEHTWWLVEGIAEYVRVKGSGKAFDQMGDVRTYLRSGHWKGDIALDDPPEGASTADVSGRYGVAYLSLQHLADRFGEDRLLDFFDATVRQGHPLDDSARQAFSMSWEDVQADCVRYVRGRN